MPKVQIKRPVEEVEVEEPMVVPRMRLFKVAFTRPPRDREVTNRVRTYVTIGSDEQDAIDRIWDAYAGSSFQTEWDHASARAEFQLGDILKIGG
jgi:hypothetical protein